MKHSISIKHNPFTVHTEFLINGEPVVNMNDFYEKNQSRRLQLWIEELFPQLCNVFNGAKDFDVEFIGVEADYLDVKAAAEEAIKNGMTVNLRHFESTDSETRLKQIQDLMVEAKQHPIFKETLKDERSDIHKNFDDAFNKDFDVYVAATMSAGKSTLINAMLGSDLLPAANEATTATIAQITDNDKMAVGEFLGKRFNKHNEEVDSEQVITLEKLKEWNSKPDTKKIEIVGNIIGINERENVRLVITDTPGPNNSQDPEHARTTMSYIQDSSRNPLILYILNATQLGVKDDQQVLGEIAKIMQKGGKQSKDRFIFIVNKIDQFDPEAGENVKVALDKVTQYLENNGISNPQIYPVSANLTRLLRKRINLPDSLTRKERGDLQAMEDLFNEEPSMNLIEYMPLTSTARKNLKAKNLPIILERSGIPAIESMIDEYIDKYNLPNRVYRAYLALEEAIKVSSDDAKLITELNEYRENISQLDKQLGALIANKDASIKAKTHLEKVIKDKNTLYPKDLIKRFDEQEANIRKKMMEFSLEFSKGEIVEKAVANRRITALSDDLQFEINRLINSMENIISESRNFTQFKLTELFNDYVKNIFDNLDIGDIPTPVLTSLQNKIKNIAITTGLGLKNDEIDVIVKTERIKVGTEEQSYREKTGTRKTSKWYNPFSWGDKEDIYETRYKTVDVYGDVEKVEEKVDLIDAWENRKLIITNYLNDLVKTAINECYAETEDYANKFMSFLSIEFDKKFEEIILELQKATINKAELSEKAKKAENALAQIEQFHKKLNNVLAL